jgi:hypothetical protein
MKNIIFILTLIIMSSCSNWQYKDFTYLKCKKLDKIHVHLYYHETCEWNCLNIDNEYYLVVDTVRVKYKTNKNGDLKKLKLIK